MNSQELQEAREILGLKPGEMAAAMGTTYDTFKEWQSERRKMSKTAVRCVELLLALKGTRKGKKFGV